VKKYRKWIWQGVDVKIVGPKKEKAVKREKSNA